MIHGDARTPDRFYDRGYDFTSVFLRGEGGHRQRIQARSGGEGAVIGDEGARSLQNHHGDKYFIHYGKAVCVK